MMADTKYLLTMPGSLGEGFINDKLLCQKQNVSSLQKPPGWARSCPLFLVNGVRRPESTASLEFDGKLWQN